MQALSIELERDEGGVFADWLGRKKIIHLGDDAPMIRLAILKDGTESGRPSAAIGIDLGDQAVIAEVTLRNLMTALKLIEAKYAGQY
jgi:hypothetical protein